MSESLRSQVRTLFGKEGTPGTAVATPNQFITFDNFDLKPMGKDLVHTTEGSRGPDLVATTMQWGELSGSALLDFNEQGRILNSLVTNAPQTNNPSTNVYEYWWRRQQYGVDTFDTYTIARDNGIKADQYAYCNFTGISIKTVREAESIPVTVTGFGGIVTGGASLTPGANCVQTITIGGTPPTGGTFTISFRGESYVAAYNVTTSALQTALQALTAIGAGGVTVTGSAGSSYVLTFASALAGFEIELVGLDITLLTGGAPTGAVAMTTAGGYVRYVKQVVFPARLGLYLDTSAAALGTTLMSRAFECDIELSGYRKPVWTIDPTQTSFSTTSQSDAKAGLKEQVKLKVAVDAQGEALLAAMKAGTASYMRLEAVTTGFNIPGSSTPYKWHFDAAIRILSTPISYGEVDGIWTYEFTAEIIYVASWGKAYEFYLRTGVASYA